MATRHPTAEETSNAWEARILAVERALEQRGLQHLLPPMSLMRRVIAGISEGRVDTERGGRVLSLSLAEVKRCVAEPLRGFDLAVSVALERLARDPMESGVSAIVRPLPLEARSTSVPHDAVTMAPPPDALPVDRESFVPEARAMLDSLVEVGDDELAAVLSAVDAPPPAAPSGAGPPRPKDELGTLREPLLGASAARVLMKGELQPGLLTDLIQLFAQNAETGRLFLEGPPETASIYFREGRVTDAECAGEAGERGFFLAMQMQKGRFSYQRGVESKHERIQRSAQHLIMDTLRLIDEDAS